jgi:polyphosphate kinase
MIHLLYAASEAGVQVDIIVRSVCCLIPQRSFSKNINVRRIVDMYLEHARVFSVWNGGHQRVFIASADWMKRNLHHRIELGVEILAPALKEELLALYNLQLQDNKTARILDKNMNMHPIENSSPPLRAQEAIYAYLAEKT